MAVIGEWSLPVLISIHEVFVIFLLPCPVKEGSDRVALVGTWRPVRVTPPQMIVNIGMQQKGRNKQKERLKEEKNREVIKFKITNKKEEISAYQLMI